MSFRLNPITHRLDLVDVVVVPPGTVASLTGDSGGAIPPDGAGTINVVGGPGIDTSGNFATNTLTVELAGGMEGTGNTIGAVTLDILTSPLGAVPGTYLFKIDVAAFEPTTPSGLTYFITAGIRTNGASGTLIGENADEYEELPLALADWAMVPIAGNNVVLRLTGCAGLTIGWKAVSNFTFRS